jgi:hypothetical protein
MREQGCKVHYTVPLYVKKKFHYIGAVWIRAGKGGQGESRAGGHEAQQGAGEAPVSGIINSDEAQQGAGEAPVSGIINSDEAQQGAGEAPVSGIINCDEKLQYQVS